MRPSSGTGHSTRPATSSSRPGSSTTLQRLRGGERGDALGDDALALGGIDQHAVLAQLRRASRRRRAHGEGAGAWKRWPSVRLSLAEPVPVIVAVAQVEADHARRRAGRAMRRSGRTQVNALRAAPAHGFRPGKAPQQRRASRGDQLGGGDCRAWTSRAPSSRLPGAAARALAPCLRRNPASACSGAVGARTALDAAGFRHRRADAAGERDAARADRRSAHRRAQAAPAPR